jgi:hypothetical protein
MFTPKLLNAIRALSSEGHGRIQYYTEILRRLDADPQFRPFFERQTTRIPQFYIDRVRRDLGSMWNWLPEGALQHDPNAYLKSTIREGAESVTIRLAV